MLRTPLVFKSLSHIPEGLFHPFLTRFHTPGMGMLLTSLPATPWDTPTRVWYQEGYTYPGIAQVGNVHPGYSTGGQCTPWVHREAYSQVHHLGYVGGYIARYTT